MADRWEPTAGGYSFRFFSPEQVDEILRDGARRGRKGSRAAIERILKHEPELQRFQLWQRIRRLKDPQRRSHHVPSIWSPEDEKILRDGYQAGWRKKRAAVAQLLKRHPDWRPHVIWQRAATLGLVRRGPIESQQRAHLRWSEHDVRTLLDLAGYKKAAVIAKILHRSEAAVHYRLATLGKSSRVRVEGFARSALARELHFSMGLTQRLIVKGLLEVRDPRITRQSLDRLRDSGRLQMIRQTADPVTVHHVRGLGFEIIASAAALAKLSRAKRVWAESAESLGMAVETVEELVLRGVLKLYDPTITEKSLRSFCQRYGAFIEKDFLDRETREWLQNSMDWIQTTGPPARLRGAALRDHARLVHRCNNCGRSIRGNAFFKHLKRCKPLVTEL